MEVFEFSLLFKCVWLLVLPSNHVSYIATPPEVNIEVPSDSDSSRRPSVYSGRRRSSFQCASDNNSMNGFQVEVKPCEEKRNNKNLDDQNISAEFSEFGIGKRSNSGQIASNNQADKGKVKVKRYPKFGLFFSFSKRFIKQIFSKI